MPSGIAFASSNEQLHASTIDLRDLQANAFEQAQSTRSDDAQADAVGGAMDLLDDAPDFLN